MQIDFAGTSAEVATAYARFEEALDAAELHGTCRYKVDLIFDEIVSNIVHHGAPDGRVLDIRSTLDVRLGEVEMTFEDDGVPFDSSVLTPRPVSSTLQDAQIGGFGLILVRNAVSALAYSRTTEARNRLVVAVRRDSIS